MSWEILDASDDDVRDAKKRWRRKARFLVDESAGEGLAEYLRSLGWNAKSVADFGLNGKSDEDVYALAARESRFVLTHDSDFLNDRRFPPGLAGGIVVLPGGSGAIEPMVRAIWNALRIIGPFADAYDGKKMVFHADGTLSIRTRNRSSGAMETHRYRLRRNAMPEAWVDD